MYYAFRMVSCVPCPYDSQTIYKLRFSFIVLDVTVVVSSAAVELFLCVRAWLPYHP